MRNLPRSERPRPSDAHVREQAAERGRLREPEPPTTLSQFARSQADEIGGRFAAEQKQTVVGATATPSYPQLPASSPWSGAQPQPPDEPPTGYRIDDLNPSPAPAGGLKTSTPQGRSGGAPSAVSPPGDDVAAPPPSSDDDGGPPDAAA